MLIKDLGTALSSPLDPRITLDGYKHASVLVIIYGKEPTIIMTEKPKYMKAHAGEISFPGGKMERSDADLLETALRETHEELGLAVPRGRVIGQLDPVVTRDSGFAILPFVAITDSIPELTANDEVQEIFNIRLEPFLMTAKADTDPAHHATREMYTFEHNGKVIWGASARILKQIQGRV